MKKVQLLLILLTIKSFYSIAQNSHDEFFSQLANRYCDCALKVKDKNEFEICGNIFKAADSIKLTEADKTYLFDKIKKQCGEVFTKYLGPQRPKIPTCSYLQESDLREFELKKSRTDRSSTQWRSTKEGAIIVDLDDHKEQFISDSLAKEFISDQQKLMPSDDFKKTQLASKIFQSLEIVSFGALGNSHMYQIYARRDKLISVLTITLSKEDLPTIEKLVDRLSERAKNCN